MDKDYLPHPNIRSANRAPARASCWVALLNWFLWLGFAIFTVAGITRMVYAILAAYWLSFSGIRPGPLYMAISGGLWGLVGLLTLVWLILRRPWYRLVGLGAALLMALTYWIDRQFIATAPPVGSNTLFAAIFTLLLLAYALLVLRPLNELRALLNR